LRFFLREAGFPDGVFQNLIVHHDKTEEIIASDIVKAVLELGDNNAFIVWEDADMKQAVETGLTARMTNSGQSCIAAKRFILVGEAYDKFLPELLERVKSLKSGDPVEESTEMGPLTRKALADQLNERVKISVEKGAELLIGGNQKEAYHEPTVLAHVKPDIPAFDEGIQPTNYIFFRS